MTRIRVLVVDDAVVVRRIVTDALAADPDIEVVGTAPNGRIALAKIPQLNPDVVTLDVEMPEMDGIETLTELRRLHPRLPVIMFSTLTERGASTTMEALLRGANDYVTKPANVGSVAEAQLRIREALIPRVHALAGRAPTTTRRAPATTVSATTTRSAGPRARTVRSRPLERVDAVVIGVSTGGPNALAEVVPALPADLAVPVYIVQHMPPMFTRLLADRLDATSGLEVREAVDGEVIGAGQVRIAPGDRHLETRRVGTQVRTVLTEGPLENSCRPAADVLFRTAAATYGPHTLAVVMTGMGSDGKRGAEHVHEVGGHVLVQDEATSVVWGMPGAVAEAGLADEVLPLSALAPTITGRVEVARGAPVGATSTGEVRP